MRGRLVWRVRSARCGTSPDPSLYFPLGPTGAIVSNEVGTLFVTGATGTVGRHVVRALAERGVVPREFHRSDATLESLFLSLVAHGSRDAAGDAAAEHADPEGAGGDA